MLDNLKVILPDHIINFIRAFPIPIMNVDDRMIWKFSNDDQFSIKTVTYTNNDSIASHSKAKLLSSI